MASSILSQEFVFSAIEAEKSGNQFPIDFDDVWKALGYSRKNDAISRLIETHIIAEDYIESGLAEYSAKPKGGRPSRKIFISIDCLKSFAMMAQTSEGKEVRRYFIEIEKAYRDNLQRTFDAPVKVDKPSKRVKSLEDEVKELNKENAELIKKIEDYREDIRKLFAESKLLTDNICNKTDFELSIDDAIDCIRPLPSASYSTKKYHIERIIFNEGVKGVDWIYSTFGARINYRFLIELAVFYRGYLGVDLEFLPKMLILEKSRVFKNTEHQVNTRFPNIGVN